MLTNTTQGNGSVHDELNAFQATIGYVVGGVNAATMVGMGCGIELTKMRDHIRNGTGVTIGIICQFVIMPLTAFVLAKMAQMEDLQTLALLIVGSCPGGTVSNIGAYWVKGDLDLSLTMTTMSTIMSFGMMPLLLYLYSFGFENTLEVPFSSIGLTMAAIILPIGIGICIKMKFPQWAQLILKVLTIAGGMAILIIIIIVTISFGSDLKVTTLQVVCAFLFPGIGIALGYGLASLCSLVPRFYLNHQHRRTICIETGIQNTQVAAAVIQTSFNYSEIATTVLFPIIYFASQMVWIAVIAFLYRFYQFKQYRKETIGKKKSTTQTQEKFDGIEKEVGEYIEFKQDPKETIDEDNEDTTQAQENFDGFEKAVGPEKIMKVTQL